MFTTIAVWFGISCVVSLAVGLIIHDMNKDE